MIVEPAPAKINLALHVRRRRPDGYHDIETLFAFCADGDEVGLADADRPSFTVTGPFAFALAGENGNLVLEAAGAFAEAFADTRNYAVTLDKRLPVASGIGGGSADAAAMLRALARRHAIDLDDPRLLDCAAQLGADVPACLLGRTAFGTGRGDDLVPLDGLAGTPVLLVNPGVALSTASVFARWDGQDRGGIAEGRVLDRARFGRNDLEMLARAIRPEIDDVLGALDRCDGVLLTRMSGSGATCFALFDDVVDRAAAAMSVRAARPDWWCLETALV